MVVVGGGPTGIETAAEMRDFFRNDVQRLFPKLSDKVKVTLVEALPSVCSTKGNKTMDNDLLIILLLSKGPTNVP